jgi:hypothetical protein
MIKVRPATAADINAYLELQAERWRDDNMADKEQLLSRLKSYPQGMLVAEENQKIVGMTYAMRITDYDYQNPPSWNEITNNGYCDNVDPRGKYFFGVDLSTAKGVGHRAGDQLMVAMGALAIREGVQRVMLGGRMPGYHAYVDKMSAQEYLDAKDAKGRPLDRQVRFYTSVPGLKALKPIENYFHDPESLDWGVLLEWRNPLYGLPGRRLWAAAFPMLFRLEDLYVKVARRFAR